MSNGKTPNSPNFRDPLSTSYSFAAALWRYLEFAKFWEPRERQSAPKPMGSKILAVRAWIEFQKSRKHVYRRYLTTIDKASMAFDAAQHALNSANSDNRHDLNSLFVDSDTGARQFPTSWHDAAFRFLDMVGQDLKVHEKRNLQNPIQFFELAATIQRGVRYEQGFLIQDGFDGRETIDQSQFGAALPPKPGDAPNTDQLVHRPPGVRPGKRLNYNNSSHQLWIAWEQAIFRFVDGAEIGALKCWTSHKKALLNIAGVEGRFEFFDIHKRQREKHVRQKKSLAGKIQ